MTTFARLKEQIESLYVGYFGRAGDSAGTSYWMSQIESGAMTLDKVAASFAVQPEALAKYSYLAAPTATNPTDFINQVYQQLFHHGADQAGLQYWSQQLASAQGNPQAIGQFILNVIFGATGADDTTLTSRVDAPQEVTVKVPNTGTTTTAPVTPQAPTETVRTSDTAPPVTSGTAAPSTNDTVVTEGIVTSGGWTLVNSSADQLVVAAGTVAVSASAAGLNTAASVSSATLSFGRAGASQFIPAGDGLIGFITPAGAFIAADGTHAYITNSSAYFFTLYDVTNSRWVVPAVADSTSTNLNSGDSVNLIGSVTMSAADYANISENHFSIVAA